MEAKVVPWSRRSQCARCAAPVELLILSFFNDELICDGCAEAESDLITRLRAQGQDMARLEGCGHIPEG